ncbi:MAG: hypothetical protein DWQ37_05685 [Planctomycetota bacterium]|nr:MAG: hypothetical protein DWQ37_05685 [Planctomycetota bacterium]
MAAGFFVGDPAILDAVSFGHGIVRPYIVCIFWLAVAGLAGASFVDKGVQYCWRRLIRRSVGEADPGDPWSSDSTT